MLGETACLTVLGSLAVCLGIAACSESAAPSQLQSKPIAGEVRRTGAAAPGHDTPTQRAPTAADRDNGNPRSATPTAMIAGRSLADAEYHAMLAEGSGGAVLEELVLESALRRAMGEAGLSLTDEMVAREREQLARTLTSAAGTQQADSEVLVEQVRRNRGLGPVRFKKLLERNAMLRALVRMPSPAGGAATPLTPQVTDEDVKQAYAIRYGPRVRARLILVRSLDAAVAALARVRPPAPADADGVQPAARTPSAEPFGDVAAQVSVDPTSLRGGLIDPISPADPSYPVAVRRAIESLPAGQVTDPIAVSWPSTDGRAPEQGYALFRVEEQLGARGPAIDSVSDELRAEVRMVRERAAMDRLAKSLVEQADRSTTVFDPSLDWSWSARRAR